MKISWPIYSTDMTGHLFEKKKKPAHKNFWGGFYEQKMLKNIPAKFGACTTNFGLSCSTNWKQKLLHKGGLKTNHFGVCCVHDVKKNML